jgi:hypothetical protein
METNVRTKPPLFSDYTVEQLTELTPYSEAYLRDLERRPERIRPLFRRVVAGVLGRPEAELFDAPVVTEVVS